MSGCGRRQAGFSLLEVLVAFVILVAALSVVYPLVGNGVRANSLIGSQLSALRLGQNQLARLGHDLPLAAGASAGEGPPGYRWELDIQPYWPWPEYPQPAEPHAWQVRLIVYWQAWNGERSLQLDSLRLADGPDRG